MVLISSLVDRHSLALTHPLALVCIGAILFKAVPEHVITMVINKVINKSKVDYSLSKCFYNCLIPLEEILEVN